MTSRKCSCNLNMFFETLKQAKYLIILHTIALFLVSTLPSVIMINNAQRRMLTDPAAGYTYLYDEISEILSGMSPYIMLVSIGICVVTAIFVFNYLFSHNSVQFYSAMPIKREKMYLTKFLAGIVSFIIPLLLIFGVNLIIYFSQNLSEFFEIGLMFKGFGLSVLAYFAMWSVACFAASISGNFFAVLIVVASVFLIYLATTGTIYASVETWFKTIGIQFHYNVIYVFPPFIVADGYVNSVRTVGEIVYTLLYSVAFSVLGLIFYRYRKNERTGNFFAYKWVGTFLKYYVTLLASLLFGALFFGISEENIVTAYIGYVLIGFIAFTVLQAIFEKNFKSMFSNLKSFAVFMLLICVAVYFPMKNREEIDKVIPKAENIKEIKVNTDSNTIFFTEKDNIQASIDLYEAARNNDDTENQGFWVSIDIRNTPLFSITRYSENWASNDDMRNFSEKTYNTAEYQQNILKRLDDVEHVDHIIKFNSIYNNGGRNNQKNIELIKLYKKDFMHYRYSDIKDSGVYAYMGTDKGSFLVYNCFERTIEFLRNNYNIEIPPSSVERIRVYKFQYDENGVYEEKELYSTNIPSEMKSFLEKTSSKNTGYQGSIMAEIKEKEKAEPMTFELDLYYMSPEIIEKLYLD